MDTYTLAGREGDVFLICSDGLTSMISDDEVASILRSAASLDEAAEALVRAANQSGGKDNITVILFRLGEGVPGDGGGHDRAGRPRTTRRSPAALQRRRLQAAATRGRRTPAVSDATVIHRRAGAASRRRRAASGAGRRAAAAVGGSRCASRSGWSLLAAVVGGALRAEPPGLLRRDERRRPRDRLPRASPTSCRSGINLYQQEYASGMPARAIPAARRARVLDHEWRSRSDAVDLVRALERGQLDAGASN